MRCSVLLLVLVPFFFASTASATTWHVPGDAPTIQAGIDSATAGDTVLVACGTYFEHGVSMKSGVCVRSVTGEPDCVTVDAEQLDRVFICEGVGDAASIEGITITGGLLPQNDIGGGILCLDSDLAISDCCITQNQAGGGGGVFCGRSSVAITGCVFHENVGDGVGAGGLRLNSCQGTVTDCIFASNWAVDGGGMFIRGHSSPLITHCLFVDNVAQFWGGGIACDQSTPTIRHCTLVDNEASATGGGIWYTYDVTMRIENTIVAFRREGGGIPEFPNTGHPSELSIGCCDVFGNAEGDYTGELDDQTGISGNFSSNPLFCDIAGGDFTIAENSPCLPGNHPYGYDCDLIGAYGQGCGVVSVNDGAMASVKPILHAFPNPFRDSIALSYLVGTHGSVVSVFDISGRPVTSYDVARPAGTITWDGMTLAGHPAAPGTYFVRLRAGGTTETRRIVLIR